MHGVGYTGVVTVWVPGVDDEHGKENGCREAKYGGKLCTDM